MSVEENLLMGAFSRTDSDIKSDVDLVFSYFPALFSQGHPGREVVRRSTTNVSDW